MLKVPITQFETDLLRKFVLQEKALTYEEFVFYLYIKGFAFYRRKDSLKKNDFMKSRKTMAQELGVSTRQVRRYIHKLKKVGLLVQKYWVGQGGEKFKAQSKEHAYQLSKKGKGKMASSTYQVLDFQERVKPAKHGTLNGKGAVIKATKNMKIKAKRTPGVHPKHANGHVSKHV